LRVLVAHPGIEPQRDDALVLLATGKSKLDNRDSTQDKSRRINLKGRAELLQKANPQPSILPQIRWEGTYQDRYLGHSLTANPQTAEMQNRSLGRWVP
jgi:hypothetical protein